MKIASVKGPSVVSIENQDKQPLTSGEIRVRMEACGICGSDVEKVFGKYGQPSMRLGHEPSGTITEIGSDIKDFKVGQRVFTHHHVPCYSCHFCIHGNETMCKTYYETNLAPCGLAEEYVVPKWNVDHGGVLLLPESVSFEEAALIEPLACCVRAWKKFPYREGDSIAILGVGPTGMMHVMLAQSKKFEKIFCLDVNTFRLDFAKKFGITDALDSSDPSRKDKIFNYTEGRGVDIAIVATSSLRALEDAISLVRKGGSVMMFGVPSKGATMNIDMNTVYSKEITISTSYAASDQDTKEALDLISSKAINAKNLITHRYTILDSQKAFEHAHTGQNAMKIIITK